MPIRILDSWNKLDLCLASQKLIYALWCAGEDLTDVSKNEDLNDTNQSKIIEFVKKKEKE